MLTALENLNQGRLRPAAPDEPPKFVYVWYRSSLVFLRRHPQRCTAGALAQSLCFGAKSTTFAFVWNSRQTHTTTILKEYYPGPNRLMYGVVAGNYEPDKHTSPLQVNMLRHGPVGWIDHRSVSAPASMSPAYDYHQRNGRGSAHA